MLLVGCSVLGCSVGAAISDAGPTLSADAGPALGVVVIGQLIDPLFGFPIADAEVCVLDGPGITCVRSNDLGRYRLTGLPRGEELVLTMEHPQHRNLARLISTREGSPPYLLRDGMLFNEDWERLNRDHIGAGPDPRITVVRAYEPELGPSYGAAGLVPHLNDGLGPLYSRPGVVLDAALRETVHESGLAVFHGAPIEAVGLSVECGGAPAEIDLWSGWRDPATGQGRALGLEGYDVVVAAAACRAGPRCSFSSSPARWGEPFVMRVRNLSDAEVQVFWVSPECERWASSELRLEAGAEGLISVRHGWAFQVVDAAGATLADFFATRRSVPDDETATYEHR